MSKSVSELAESKLIILYLLYKMDLPLTNSQISQFTLEADYMDYFSLQQYLIELYENKLIDKNKDNNVTRYTITEDGERTLAYFIKHISENIRRNIKEYVRKTKGIVKLDFEVVANYFYNSENDYIVKCGVYENDMTLMEISVSVVSKEQAKFMCNNWKTNVNKFYGDILNLLISKDEQSQN